MNKKNLLVVAISYIILTILFTYPIITKINYALIGNDDSFFYPWNIYTFQKNILNQANPFITRDVLYPLGSNLLFHAYGSLSSLLTLIIPSNNFIFKENLVVLSGLFLSAISMYFLILKLTKNIYASFLSGFIFALSPIIFSALLRGHHYFSHAEFIPLTVLAYLYFQEKPKIKRALLVGILIWLSSFNEYYQTLFSVMIISILFLAHIITTKNKLKLAYQVRNLLIGIGLPSLFFFLFLAPIIINTPKRTIPLYGDAPLCSASLFQPLIPSKLNPVLKKISPILSARIKTTPTPDTPWIYVGITPIALAIIAIKKSANRSNVLIFTLILIFGYLMSLGPILKLNDYISINNELLPYRYLSKIPILNNARCPVRYFEISQFALAVLAGFGLTTLIKKHKKKSVSRNLIILGFLVAVFVEYANLPMITSEAKVPTVYRYIANKKSNKTLLEIPSGTADGFGAIGAGKNLEVSSRQMFLQTVHQKPRVGGYLARIPDSTYKYFLDDPWMLTIFLLTDFPQQASSKSFNLESTEEFVNKFNLGYIIIWPFENQKILEEFIDKNLKNLIYEKLHYENYVLYTLKE